MSSYSQRIFKKYDLKFGKNLAKFSRNVPWNAERNGTIFYDLSGTRNGTEQIIKKGRGTRNGTEHFSEMPAHPWSVQWLIQDRNWGQKFAHAQTL